MIKKGSIITLLLTFSFGFYYLYVRLPIINGYAAKNMCSCLFVSNRTQELVEEHELNFSFLKYTSHKVDTINKTVESSFFGFRTRTAYYNPDLGCALVNQKENVPLFKAIDFDEVSIAYKEDSILKINLVTKNDKLNKIVNAHIENKAANTTALLVIHNSKLLAEKYSKGYTKESRFLGWSMAKSIMSTLVGILVKEGKINIEETINEPTWQNDERKNITWNNVLQMSTGLKWEENYGSISDVTKMLYTQDDVYKTAVKNKLEFPTNSYYEYSSGSSNILAGQIKKQFETEEEYLKFPYEKLFSKLGMKSMLLETDPNGTFVGSSYAWATARDWAKYGLLYLHKGSYNGEQILPVDWTKYTSTPADNSKGKYGAQFWLHTPEEFPNVSSDLYFADGFQGQRVFILPSENLVVVRFGLHSDNDVDFNQLLKDIVEAL